MSRNTEIPGYGFAKFVNREAPGCLPYALLFTLVVIGIGGLSQNVIPYGEAKKSVGRPNRNPLPTEPTKPPVDPDDRYARGKAIVESLPFGKSFEDEQSRQESQPVAPVQNQQPVQGENPRTEGSPEGVCNLNIPSDVEYYWTVDGETFKGRLINGIAFGPKLSDRAYCKDVDSYSPAE